MFPNKDHNIASSYISYSYSKSLLSYYIYFSPLPEYYICNFFATGWIRKEPKERKVLVCSPLMTFDVYGVVSFLDLSVRLWSKVFCYMSGWPTSTSTHRETETRFSILETYIIFLDVIITRMMTFSCKYGSNRIIG